MESAETGLKLRFTLAAITGGFRICQSFLGEKDPIERRGADLVPALRQTVGVLFSALESDFPVWSAVAGSQEVPTTGSGPGVAPGSLAGQSETTARDVRQTGVAELESVFQSILSPSTLAELKRIAALGEEEFRYPAELVGQDGL